MLAYVKISVIPIDPICQMPDQKNTGAKIQKECCDMY